MHSTFDPPDEFDREGDRLSPGMLLGLAAACFALEQLVLALFWDSARGWIALGVAPLVGVVVPLALVLRRTTAAWPQALGLRRLDARQIAASVMLGVGSLAPAHLASRALRPWVQPPADLFDLYAGLLPTGPLALAAGAVAVTVLAPWAEELLFRGLGLRSLRAFCGTPAAIALTAILFGFAHGSVWAAIPITVFGGLLGILAWRTGGITAPWIAHGVFNAIAYAELCITRDATSEAVAHFATQPTAIAVAIVLILWGIRWSASGSRAPGSQPVIGDYL